VPEALPETLPEPLVYLSARQRLVVQRYRELQDLVDDLPCWVPHRRIAQALGHDESGIRLAMESLQGRPYVWATEFENVHSVWRYQEPTLTIDGKKYPNSEEYFHSQKPQPFDKALWDGGLRVEVMQRGVRAKLLADDELRALLLSTHPHPLLSLKPDAFWGFDPRRGGENMLARLLMTLRAEFLREEGGPLEEAAPSLGSPENEEDDRRC